MLLARNLDKVTGRQHHGCIITQAVSHSLVYLKMGEIIPPKHVELIGIINTLRTGDADLRFYITTVKDG